MNLNKLKKLKELGHKRKEATYDGYKNIADFHDGKYESEFVSPYTNTAKNVDSPIAILLQDWSSFNSLSKKFKPETAELGYTPNLRTNKNLSIFLKEVFGLSICDVFVTNAFPFIKKDNLSADIYQLDINRAFTEFCYPQLEIVKPKLVVCCGKQVFIAAVNHFKQKEIKYEINESFKIKNMVFYYQSHPGYWGTINSGGENSTIKNWEMMREKFLS